MNSECFAALELFERKAHDLRDPLIV
ncbi:hypothetical protein Bhyg_11787 [Pseudolycoriella hygida]|uniref:Uncharacterized protein n=1 Tax=Pseudolycoriella hygida TaxID=35572 RepID=A0A9Q0S0N2_9DIPT|nr:hypothetical protein Bhyg_11787 [Pseudolycoriella hygida]